MFTTFTTYIGKGSLYVFSAHKEGENEPVTLKSNLEWEFDQSTAEYAQSRGLASLNVRNLIFCQIVYFL